MRSDLVVLPEPNIDSDLGLSCGVEPFCVEDFFLQGAVKASSYHVLGKQCPTLLSNPSTFPRAARIDLHWFDPNLLQRVL